jgi:hypothetical protein
VASYWGEITAILEKRGLSSGGQLTAAAAPGLLQGGGRDRGPEDLEDVGGGRGYYVPNSSIKVW